MAPRLPTRLPAPLLALVRLLGLPVAEVTRYWRQEQRAIRMGVAALMIGAVATLIAGTVLGAARTALGDHPGLLLLIPPAIGMRGNIFGALAARLSTAILTGEFATEDQRSNVLGRQITAVTVLTLLTSAQAALLARGIGALFHLPTIPLLDLVTVSVIGSLISSAVLLFVTLGIARLSHHRDWNMDDFGAPTITATGDLITLPAILLATAVLDLRVVTVAIGYLGLAIAAAALWYGWRHDDGAVRRIIRESVVVLTIAVTLGVIAGSVLEQRLEQLVAVPALLVLIPPFVANCGSLGGLLSSRLGSKLHIGLIEPLRFPGKDAALDISITWALAFTAFTGVGVVGWLGARLVGLSPPHVLTLLAVSLLGGLLATLLLSAVAYIAATASFRFGFDPDNHGIPIVTSTMDLLGMFCLVGAIGIMGVG